MMVAAGHMTTYITIETPTYAQNAVNGQQDITWHTFKQMKAAKNPQKGKEPVYAEGRLTEQQAIFVIPYMSSLKTTMRIKEELPIMPMLMIYTEKYWNILSIRVIGFNQQIEIVAESLDTKVTP